MCLVVLNTSAVQEQASTAARAGRCGSQYVRSFSELDTVLETVLAQQTKLDAQAAVVAWLTGCIAEEGLLEWDVSLPVRIEPGGQVDVRPQAIQKSTIALSF